MAATNSNEQEFFKKNYTTSISFLAAVLLFLLPFVEIRCNNMVVAQNSGIGLAFGSDFKASNQFKSEDRTNYQDGYEDVKNKDLEGKLYAPALIALLLGITGLLISYARKGRGIINSILGLMAALSMIILLVQLKSDTRNKLETGDSEFSNQFAEIEFTAEFTPWFYISLVAFLAAAFFSYRKTKLSAGDGIPKNAPQLDLQNPNDQSEFPKSPSESELG